MKRIIIAVALIIICLAASICEVLFVSRSASDYYSEIEMIDVCMRKDDFENAISLCSELNSRWSGAAKMVDALLIHDYVDSVGLSLGQMQRYIENGDPAMYFAESEKAKRALASLRDSEYPTADNIL